MKLLHSRKFRILLAIVAFVVLWPFILKGIYYLQAPKFKAIHYQSTEQTYGCLWVITDAGCTTEYSYTASGKEVDIVNQLATELKKRGYKLNETNGEVHVSCGLHGGDTYNQYSFIKPKKGFAYPETMYVKLYLPTDGDYRANLIDQPGFSCSDVNGNYSLRILTSPAQ